MTRITDERIEVIAGRFECCNWPDGEDAAAALRELQLLRAQHREIICRQCGLSEQLGEVTNVDFR